jgi:hypothetical protein
VQDLRRRADVVLTWPVESTCCARWRGATSSARRTRGSRCRCDVAAAYATGVALNAVIPGRGGDVVKIALPRRRLHGSSVATIASSTPVLVVLDLLAATALLVALVATRGLPFAVSAPGTAVWLVPALVVAVLVAALGARHLRPRIARLWSQLRQGGAILRTRGRPAYPAGAGTVMTSARSSHLRRGRQAHLGLV